MSTEVHVIIDEFSTAYKTATEAAIDRAMATHLFIGGAANGQRINVPDGATFFRVSSGKFGTEYRRERLASPSRQWVVFVENHLTLDTAMQALIDCYHPQEDFATLPEY